MKNKLIPEISAIIANQTGETAKISPHTSVNPELLNSIVLEIEEKFNIKMQKPYDKCTVEDLAKAICLGLRFKSLCEEVKVFANRFYGLNLSIDETLEGANGKSFVRVADCYIIKTKVSRKNKQQRKKIREAKSIEEMVGCIVYSC